MMTDKSKLIIIGFGNQAKAWSLNLKDSNFPYQLTLRPHSPSISRAEGLGHEVEPLSSEIVKKNHLFALLIPDSEHAGFLKTYAKDMPLGSVIIYPHGFSAIHHKLPSLYPNLNHFLYAPKCIGTEMRNQFLQKGEIGAVMSFEYFKHEDILSRNDFEKWVKNFSLALGINLGPFQTTFFHETVADLFSEQSLLCSLIPYAAEAIFRKMVNYGISPELAYLECWKELKLITSSMVDLGPKEFFNNISPNALEGSEIGYKHFFQQDFTKKLDHIFENIITEKFSHSLENSNLSELRKKISSRWLKSPLQKTFENLHSSDIEE